MNICFYFCVPIKDGKICAEPFILTSLSGFYANQNLVIYRCVINGLDTYVKEL